MLPLTALSSWLHFARVLSSQVPICSCHPSHECAWWLKARLLCLGACCLQDPWVLMFSRGVFCVRTRCPERCKSLLQTWGFQLFGTRWHLWLKFLCHRNCVNFLSSGGPEGSPVWWETSLLLPGVSVWSFLKPLHASLVIHLDWRSTPPLYRSRPSEGQCHFTQGLRVQGLHLELGLLTPSLVLLSLMRVKSYLGRNRRVPYLRK